MKSSRLIASLRFPARPSNPSLAACACGAVALVASALWLGLPALGRADDRNVEAGRLLARAAQLESARAELDAARLEVERAKESSARVRRIVPADPDQGSLMRMLAVDAGPEVGTQTIVAGESVPATPSASVPYRAVPVTIDMKATFGRVMELVARAEGAARLVRPIRIEIARPLEGERGAPPSPEGFVDARIELDAVYAATDEEGSAP